MTDIKNKFCCSDKYNLYEMCLSCYNAYFTDPEFEAAMHDSYWNEQDIKYIGGAKCECGGESTGENLHSHWCPKGSK
jgi:hypothetical protein